MTHFYDVRITTDLDETVCLQIPAMSPAEAEEAAIYMVEHGEAGTLSTVVIDCFASL